MTVAGRSTAVPDLPDADLHLVDAGALTYAAVRTDGATSTLLAAARPAAGLDARGPWRSAAAGTCSTGRGRLR